MQNIIQTTAALQPTPRDIRGLQPGLQAAHEGPPSLWPNFLNGQPGQPVRVLLIDDDPHIRKVISQELLGDLRTDVVGEASNMREGRRLISQLEFDVMLVDLNLGDGTGFDLIDHMKTNDSEIGKTEMSLFATKLHEGSLITDLIDEPPYKGKKVKVSYNKRQFYDRILTPMKSMGLIDYDLYKKTYRISDKLNKDLQHIGLLWIREMRKPAKSMVR